jgi:predicted dienelactone hydrolase
MGLFVNFAALTIADVPTLNLRPPCLKRFAVTSRRNHPSAQTMKQILQSIILLVALCGQVSAQTNTIETQRAVWHDAKRDRDVPVKIYSPRSGNGPFPVILFSHGLGGSREGYEYLGEHWAAHGYVSVHLQHLGSDEAVWRDTGLLKRKRAMQRSAADPQNAINRPRDISFAIDELERLNRDSPIWKHRLDLERIGVAGHSFGAFTTLASAGQKFQPGVAKASSFADPRVKAAIPMSAPTPKNKSRLDEVYAGVQIPCLHMTGTKDSSPIGDTTPAERRLPFDHCKNSDQFLITFKDGDHMIFSGRTTRAEPSDKKFQRLIQQSSTAFWDAYLRADAKAKSWLTNDFKRELDDAGKFEMRLKR